MTMKLKGRFLLMAALAAASLGVGCGENLDDILTDPTPSGAERLSGSITTSRTLTADKAYILSGAVFVRSGATLTIRPGTTIFGEKSTLGALVIERGARIDAQGTADSPIIMTSDQPAGRRARGDWGGLIINGSAPLNIPGGVKSGEGDTGQFGGTNAADNSGTIRYVRVEFAGIEFSPDNELNGIAFQGVGSGTTCDHLQVHYNQDDGFEWFGGTVSCKFLLATAAGDDSFDWTDGWSGRGQFWVAQQKGDDADAGFEADNLEGNVEVQPRSNPTIFNVTLIGDPGTTNGAESTNGMVLRRGTAGTLRNFIVTGFKQRGVDVRDASVAQAQSGALSMANSIVFGNTTGSVNGFTTWLTAGMVQTVDPQIAAPFNLSAPNFQPSASGPARNGSVAVAAPPGDGFFESVNFIGAVGANDWTKGWTTSAQN
jgi:hypothetical protein